jgi:antitoxin FitA
MPVSITIKNIPDDLYLRLKHAANANHRSMNGQAIASLDDALKHPRQSAEEWLAGVDTLRKSIGKKFKAADIARFKQTGRK